MGDTVFINSKVVEPKTLYQVDSGALNFCLKNSCFKIILISKQWPHKELYKVDIGAIASRNDQRTWTAFGRGCCVYEADLPEKYRRELEYVFTLDKESNHYHNLWLSFHNGNVSLGQAKEGKLLFNFKISKSIEHLVGSLKINTQSFTDCALEVPPQRPQPKRIDIKTGRLRWEKVDYYRIKQLPQDAFIAGMLKEPLYIVRLFGRNAKHIGIYMANAKRYYFVKHPREYNYGFDGSTLEILCGYDAEWVYPENGVPENAVVCAAGMHIGRGYHQGHLLVGHADCLKKICTVVDCKDKQISLTDFQVLVSRETQPCVEDIRDTFRGFPKWPEVPVEETRNDDDDDALEGLFE